MSERDDPWNEPVAPTVTRARHAPVPAGRRSDFDDPAVAAKYLPGGIYYRAAPTDDVSVTLFSPATCPAGEHVHGLALTGHWPRPQERVPHLGKLFDAVGSGPGATWRCATESEKES